MATSITTDLLYVGGGNQPGIGFRDESSGGDLGWVIGANDRGGSAAGENAFVIHSMQTGGEINDSWQSNGTEVFTVGQSGNVGIGSTNPGYKLMVNGSFYAAGSSLLYKENIEDYSFDNEKILKLKPVQYNYKEEYKHLGKNLLSGLQIGLIAEEVNEIYPELSITVKENKEDIVRNVDYEKISVILVGAIQNLHSRIRIIKES